MRTKGFTWTVEELESPFYRYRALDLEKESDKYYPGLKELKFDLFSFNLT